MYDPNDPKLYLSHQGGTDKTWKIDGKGNLFINGSGSRCFIEIPNTNVETTLFLVWNENLENVSILNRSSHSRRYENDCGFGGYHSTLRSDTAYFRKEGLSHPLETSRVKEADVPAIKVGDIVGFRFVTKTEGGNVRNTIFVSTDNGIEWNKTTEWLDDGSEYFGLDEDWSKPEVQEKVKKCPTVHGVKWTKESSKEPWLLQERSVCLRFDTLPDKTFDNLQITNVIIRSLEEGEIGPEPPTKPEPIPTTPGEIWNSKKILTELEGKTLEPAKYYDNGALYISKAGDEPKVFKVQNGYLTFGGGGKRIYAMVHNVAGGRNKSNLEMEFIANVSDKTEKLSIQVGNHEHDSLQFGGYGNVLRKDSFDSSVEYYHGEADDTSEKKVTGPLPKPMPYNKDAGYKMRIEDRGDDKVMNFWIDYNNDGNWTHVVKDRTWTNENWSPGESMPESGDKAQVEQGVYHGPLTSFWIRNNSEETENPIIKIKDIKIRTL